MAFVFAHSSLAAYLTDKPDRLAVEHLLLSGSMAYTYDMVLSDLYEERNHAVGATQAHQEMEELRSQLAIWSYPVFDAEAIQLQEIYGMPYSDAVCAAIARQLGCLLVTADHLSFDTLLEDKVCGIIFTR